MCHTDGNEAVDWDEMIMVLMTLTLLLVLLILSVTGILMKNLFS
jgi:cytochrome b subunit of formate dehydrogenase